ncbi:hypothetical protein [Paludisphaera mucosa]|uniref:PDZ domain-containing protein n=1 Tax=Paludisphaera mucosa TaxID=3030827 RepID=A0ABT6FDX7_9BACT|nr:hypothetical protein [Paludisphaera mucosa]MDG3005781.1 hypothetical protein [Paludisphaera mucosa]
MHADRSGSRSHPSPRRTRNLVASARAFAVALGVVLAGSGGSRGFAQTPPDDFLNPILTMNALGHTDLIQALAFTPDGKRLLTGGRDKVVHIWELDEGRPQLEGSIRPPMRRRGGRVYALAISSRVDANHQRLAAVAGMGAIGARGGILFYRIPGAAGRRAGDLAFELPPGRSDEPAATRRGHAGAVLGLAFSPDGGRLASCGDENDRTVRIWDLDGENPRSVAVLEGHAGSVKKVAFLDNDRLVSVGGAGDGSVRLWDAKTGRLLRVASPSAEALAKDAGKAVTITALAASPDGRHVVVGREDGNLERYDGAGLGGRLLLNPEKGLARRPVEALAFSPDGKTLAVSVLKNAATVEEFPSKDCDVELREMPAGRRIETVRTAKGLVMALAFSPDGRFLAMGGGDRQEVVLRDLRNPARADAGLQADGPGTMLWDVAFVDAKPTVAFRGSRAAGAAQHAWEGFDLAERRFQPVAVDAALQRSVATLEGWTFRPRAFDRVEIVPAQGEPIAVALNPLDVRWSSFTFIPPSAQAGHVAPCAAIGTEDGGILVYNLRDRSRTRLFLGHGGAVHAMAPSADGRWLVAASADMTLSLWNLAGCDVRTPLGADLGRDPQGRVVVTAVRPRSAAVRLGLKPGDVIAKLRRNSRREPLDVAKLDEAVAGLPPDLDDQAVLEVVRPGVAAPVGMVTPRADVPALSLFPAADREWVVWMPEGYYETSIAGDRRLLGWHVNHVDVTNPADFRSLPSDFHPMSRFETQLRRPAVIDALLRTGDPVAALATVQGPPIVRNPPVIRLIAPGPAAPGAEIVAAGADANLQIEAEASADRRIRSIVVHNGPRRLTERLAEPAVPLFRTVEAVRLAPDRNVVTVEAVDDLGVRAIQDFTIRLAAPLPAPLVRRDPRLVIRSIGVEEFPREDVGTIRNARRDAEELAAFFKEPDGRSHFADGAIDAQVLINPDSGAIAGLFDGLAEGVKAGRLKAGDTVVVVLESHLFKAGEGGSLVLAADSRATDATPKGASTGAIAERLEEVAAQGCFVLVLVDALHAGASPTARAAFKEWARDLSGRRGVVVAAASKHDPSERLEDHGAFARAVLSVATVAGGSAARSDADAPMTLYEFQAGVLRLVSELTARRQFAGFYPPETLSGWQKIRLFEPQPTPGDDLVRR